LDPEAIAEFLGSFRCRATRSIEPRGGIVDKFVGDDVMGVFGVPIATLGDAANALAAGRALLAEIATWMKSAGVRGAGQFPSESASTMAKCSPASSKAESG
jgi:adenylate cyclase